MTETTSPVRRPALSVLVGAALGFGVAVAAFLGPLGWVAAILLLGALAWFMARTGRTEPRRRRVVGVGAIVGVLLYVGLAVTQNLFDAPPSGSDTSLINGTLPYL